ncbi:MAG: DUF4252 domain-containing protein [Cyclobacteriaceae bacterium]
MKKIVIGMMLLALSVAAQAQGDAIAKFFNKYQNDESFTQVTVSSKMFNLFTNMDVEKPEDKEVLDAISKLKGLKVLVKEEARNARELYKEAYSMIPANQYEELMFMRDKDKDMKFYIRETSPGKISELVRIMGGNEEFMIMSIFGEIDLKQISKIGRKMDIDGLDELEKIDDGKSKKNDE